MHQLLVSFGMFEHVLIKPIHSFKDEAGMFGVGACQTIL
jgi:hypothetical protein